MSPNVGEFGWMIPEIQEVVQPFSQEIDRGIFEERRNQMVDELDGILEHMLTPKEQKVFLTVKGDRKLRILTNSNNYNTMIFTGDWRFAEDCTAHVQHKSTDRDLTDIVFNATRQVKNGSIALEICKPIWTHDITRKLILKPLTETDNHSEVVFRIGKHGELKVGIFGKNRSIAEKELREIFGNLDCSRLTTDPEYQTMMYKKWRKALFSTI